MIQLTTEEAGEIIRFANRVRKETSIDKPIFKDARGIYELMQKKVKSALAPVSESAFVVHVNHKCIIVLAKTVQDVHDKLRADGVEWKTISVEAIDGTI